MADESGVDYEEEGLGDDEKPWPQRVPPAVRAPDKPGLNRFAWNLRYPNVAGEDLLDKLERQMVNLRKV